MINNEKNSLMALNKTSKGLRKKKSPRNRDAKTMILPLKVVSDPKGRLKLLMIGVGNDLGHVAT